MKRQRKGAAETARRLRSRGCEQSGRSLTGERWTEGDFATMQAAISHVPLNRIGQPDEVARTVLFLVSDDASYFNGAVLCVDGGELSTFRTSRCCRVGNFRARPGLVRPCASGGLTQDSSQVPLVLIALAKNKRRFGNLFQKIVVILRP